MAPTIKDVAKKAGMSLGTVSYALNHDPRIKPQTAEKVRAAALSLGYALPPQGAPRGFRRSSGKKAKAMEGSSVVFIFIGKLRSVLRAPLYSSVLDGAECQCSRCNMNLVVRMVDSPEELNHDSDWRGNAGGVIMLASPNSSDIHDAIHPLPCVNVTGQWTDFWDHVVVDDELVGELAAKYIAGKGHKVCASVADGPRIIRQSSFVKHLEDKGVRTHYIQGDLVYADQTQHAVNRQNMVEVIERMMALTPRPTAVFFLTDMLTAAAYPIMIEKGILPGTDIDVVSCNNEEILLANLHPRPAVVDIHAFDIGRAAVTQLLWRRENPTAPLRKILIRPSFAE